MQKEPSTGGPFLSFDAERQASISPMKKQICARLLTVCSIQFTFGSLESIRNAKTSIKSSQARPQGRKGMPENRSALQASLPRSALRGLRSVPRTSSKSRPASGRASAQTSADVPLGDGRDGAPSHLHTPRAGRYRTRYKQSAVEQVPRLHRGEAEKYDGEQIDERHRGAEASGMVSLVMRFLAFLLMASSVMIFLCFLFCPKAADRRGGWSAAPAFSKKFFYTRFHFAPPGMSVTSTPCALSSSRMRSASAKFFAFLASARWRIRFSMPSSAVPSSETTVKRPRSAGTRPSPSSRARLRPF